MADGTPCAPTARVRDAAVMIARECGVRALSPAARLQLLLAGYSPEEQDAAIALWRAGKRDLKLNQRRVMREAYPSVHAAEAR